MKPQSEAELGAEVEGLRTGPPSPGITIESPRGTFDLHPTMYVSMVKPLSQAAKTAGHRATFLYYALDVQGDGERSRALLEDCQTGQVGWVEHPMLANLRPVDR